MNYGDDLEAMLGFFSGNSAFYPDFDALLRREVRAAVPKKVAEEED